MKKVLFIWLVFLSTGQIARADLFGGDDFILGQILQNAIQQLSALTAILGAGQGTLGLLSDINKGVNDSLNLIQTVGQYKDPGFLGNLKNVQDILRKVQDLYGTVVPSLDAPVQQDADQSVVDAIKLNNSIYQYTNDIDAIGEEIKQFSHQVSPGGAQKLTAQTLGVMLHVLNEQLRAQATDLRLHAQELAIQNKKDKDATKHALEITDALKNAMQSEKNTFDIPRF